MATIIDPETMYFGAPASLQVGGVEVGATLDAPKVAFEITKYTPEFKNAKGPVKNTVIVRKVIPRIEFTVNELTAAKLAWAMPGVTATVGTAAETGGGADTTLAADVAAGATNIKVTSVANMAIGDFLRVGDVGETEIREIVTVGTAGSGGTGIDLDTALSRAHDNADVVREVDDRGTTIFAWTPGRVPSASYKDVVAIGPGLDGREMIVTIKNALSAEPIELPMDDEAMTGLAVVMIGHYVYDGGADSGKVPFALELS